MTKPPVECNQVIEACDEALEAKNKEIEQLHLGLVESMGQSTALTRDLGEANSKLESPFRNPYLMILLGGLIGLGGGVYLMKR